MRKKLEWPPARFIIIVILSVLAFLFAISCDNEPVDYESDCCDKFASIVANNDCFNSRPGYSYEGDYSEWFILREWKEGDCFIVTLESCNREIYYGKYLIKMID